MHPQAGRKGEAAGAVGAPGSSASSSPEKAAAFITGRASREALPVTARAADGC